MTATENAIVAESSDQLSGYLTFEKWNAWNSQQLERSMSLDDKDAKLSVSALVNSQFHGFYQLINKSDWILSNFLSLPLSLQGMLLELVKYPVENSVLEDFTQLVLDFKTAIPGMHLPESYRHFSSSILNACDGPSQECKMAIKEFRYLRKSEHVIIRSLVFDNTGIMLSQMFGETLFIEVTNACSDLTSDIEISSFIHLMKNWEELKRYPIDWAVNLSKN